MPINRMSVFPLIHHLETSNLVGSEFQRNKGGPCNTLKTGSKDSGAFDRGLMSPKKRKWLFIRVSK